MQLEQTKSYKGHQLTVVVEQRPDGRWFVFAQSYTGPTMVIPGHVAHVQHDGPFGSEAQAFQKGFRDLQTFIDQHVVPDRKGD